VLVAFLPRQFVCLLFVSLFVVVVLSMFLGLLTFLSCQVVCLVIRLISCLFSLSVPFVGGTLASPMFLGVVRRLPCCSVSLFYSCRCQWEFAFSFWICFCLGCMCIYSYSSAYCLSLRFSVC